MTEHAVDRAQERYGVELTREDVDEMASRILSGDGVLWRTTNEGRMYFIKWEGVVMIPVMRDGVVVTFYPPDAARSGTGLARWGRSAHTRQQHKKRKKRSGACRS